MISVFDNQEAAYLQWLQANPTGYVVNIDRAQKVKNYPMIHIATHGLVSSQKIGNFTTGDYIKFCSTDLKAMEQWLQTKYGRRLTYCTHCERRMGRQRA